MGKYLKEKCVEWRRYDTINDVSKYVQKKERNFTALLKNYIYTVFSRFFVLFC